MKYYHYSKYPDLFDVSKVQPIENVPNSVSNKPKHISGYWGTPVDSENGWETFCLDNEVFFENILYRSVFELKPQTKIITVEALSDLNKLTPFLLPNNTGFNNVFLDWEKMSTVYHAFFLKIKKIEKIQLTDPYIEFWRYFCDWDVDSILVFNGHCICKSTKPEFLSQYANRKTSLNESSLEIIKKKYKNSLNIYYK